MVLAEDDVMGPAEATQENEEEVRTSVRARVDLHTTDQCRCMREASTKTKGQPCQRNHSVIVVGNSEMGKLFSPGTFFSIEASDKARMQIVIKVDVFIEKEKGVTLDNIQLTFKELYMSRADMWRYRSRLINTCAYLDKQILIYIQMSSEMWQLDPQGDLYFEKCVKGFMSELFSKWHANSSAHYVSIILCSRFYLLGDVDKNIEEQLGPSARDHRGRYFQDFYRLLVQNEHYEDWSHVLSTGPLGDLNGSRR
ncbi:hypothetical protein ANCDUO_00310 [Ancylostoma duodenale]|uniref:Vacuolar membrane-associated protein Iml1 N-terminal domain-containing protein n=1 Tax=Ancylostoma duodenale TaxID=51022 RepID=A0A0C2E1S9_9BILA|nr:hypothetical protein ANCDUO_00310 [Ancylostoma duodenale]